MLFRLTKKPQYLELKKGQLARKKEWENLRCDCLEIKTSSILLSTSSESLTAINMPTDELDINVVCLEDVEDDSGFDYVAVKAPVAGLHPGIFIRPPED